MRKSIITALVLCFVGIASVSAQKFAFIDSEYILENIQEYKQNKTKMEAQAKTYQAEVQKLGQEIEKLYSNLQEKAKGMSEAQLAKEQEKIQKKEEAAMELGKKYFGPEGAMAKMKETLIDPFHDKIYEAAKVVAMKQDYAAIIDRATANSIIFAQPKYDISNEILSVMGYSK